MITKEQKQLIKEVKRESGTNEFLSVSDLIVRIEQNYKEKGEDIYYEDVGITFSEWNDFLRNTPLSMDLFIGEGAIFEGFEVKELGSDSILTLEDNKLGLNIVKYEKQETYFQWIPGWEFVSRNLPYKDGFVLAHVPTLKELAGKINQENRHVFLK